MAYSSLKDFILFLEERNELKRIKEKVSPELEMTEIADRAVKSQKEMPALLFENVEGSPFPVLINAFASKKRAAWALGVENFDEVAAELESLVKTQPPQNWVEKFKMLPKLAKVASFMPKKVSTGACQEETLPEVDLSKLPI